jgi:hypothetical protein
VPDRQPGAAPVTLRTYTHALPDDIERARDQLADYLERAAPPRGSMIRRSLPRASAQ